MSAIADLEFRVRKEGRACSPQPRAKPGRRLRQGERAEKPAVPRKKEQKDPKMSSSLRQEATTEPPYPRAGKEPVLGAISQVQSNKDGGATVTTLLGIASGPHDLALSCSYIKIGAESWLWCQPIPASAPAWPGVQDKGAQTPRAQNF